MIKGISLALAIGLVILWLVGLSHHATPWLTWLDGLAALFGFAMAAGAGTAMGRAAAASGPIGLALGLGILWIVGLTTHSDSWLTWWTFVFGCAFLLLGLVVGSLNGRVTRTTTHPRPA